MDKTFTCPISRDIMKDPVVAPDGQTYEREAIEEWVRINGTSPHTRSQMNVDQLVPNRALRELIEHHRPTLSELSERNVQASTTVAPIPQSADTIAALIAETTATIHTNSTRPEQSIVHVNAPNFSDSTIPCHICCVIDVSGSMRLEAACKDENGLENKTGLCILDVVKFSTLVISKSLRSIDKLSIVTYSDDATTVLEPTNMDKAGKYQVENILATIHPQNMTNLWAGLKTSIQLAHEVGEDYNSSIFVLTDGIPNIDPPLGYERSLKKLLQKLSLFGSLCTFGFGSSLNTPLLTQISQIGGGFFSFIPDAGFVGTCFINAISNARCAYGIKPSLRITNSASIVGNVRVQSIGEMIQLEDDQTLMVQLNPIRYGSSIDIVLNRKNLGEVNIELVFQLVGGKEVIVPVTETNEVDTSSDLFHTTRNQFIQDVFNVTSTTFDGSNSGVFLPSDEVNGARVTNEDLDALCRDLEGQASEAVSKEEWYTSWGRHYLQSLVGAHLHQLCNNFKDPGVQIYGRGTLFSSLQDDLNDIFEKISPPRASPYTVSKRRNSATRRARRNAPATHITITSMSTAFNNRNAVCFHPKTKVTVKSRSGDLQTRVTSVCSVNKGDHILTENGEFVEIECVVETVTNNPLELVKIQNLYVTPYHPVKLGKTRCWEFPIECHEGDLVLSDSNVVYNLVLAEGVRDRAVIMDGIACITLGHGITNDSVLRHEYFGTDCIVNDLKKMKSAWKSGLITLSESDIKRKDGRGEICRISPGGEILHNLVPNTVVSFVS